MRVALVAIGGPSDRGCLVMGGVVAAAHLVCHMRGIENDAMTHQQGGVFVGKPFLAVMDLLIADIIAYVAVFERGDAEGPVSVLPPEIAPVGK
jgi:hypothetical protein